MKATDLVKAFTLNPKWRLIRHIEYLKHNITISHEHDQENFDRVYKNFHATIKRYTFYTWIRNVVFILLYISLIASIAQGIAPIISDVFETAARLTAIIGVTLLTLAFVFLERLLHAIFADMIIEHAHLVSILVKNNKDFTVHPHYKWGLFQDYE